MANHWGGRFDDGDYPGDGMVEDGLRTIVDQYLSQYDVDLEVINEEGENKYGPPCFVLHVGQSKNILWRLCCDKRLVTVLRSHA